MNSKTDGESQLECTGERYLPDAMTGVIELEHLHRYAMARELAFGKVVLDIACGEGYGADLLAAVATRVIGVDVSKEAVAYATAKYTRKNLKFVCGSAAEIPLANASVDLVVSFETIEHHAEHREMFAEIRRVLRPDGLLLISSPDKHEYSDVPGYHNPYHVRELYLNEFEGLLRVEFSQVKIFGQRVCYGSLVGPVGGSDAVFATFTRVDQAIHRCEGLLRPIYFVAMASNGMVPQVAAGLYDGSRTLDDHLSRLDPDLSRLFPKLFRLLNEREAAVLQLDQHAKRSDAEAARLAEDLAVRDGEVARLGQALAARDEEVARLLGEAAARDAERDRLMKEFRQRDSQVEMLKTDSANVERLLNEERAARQHEAAERDQLALALHAVHVSTSWRLSAPLRFAKIAASSLNPLRGLRRLGSLATRTTYRFLPLPSSPKVGLKTALFSSFPFLFRKTAAYEAWQSFVREQKAPRPVAHQVESASQPIEDKAVWQSAAETLFGELYSDGRSDYVPCTNELPPTKCVRAIAFYLPQYHPIPENDRWWGRGFTEWRNVGRARPEFLGHYQPRLPGELGYYDLRVPAVQQRQVELAKAFGIDAFCFYFYWFDGKTLLELPLRQYLDSRELDLTFCVCWANENWTRTWDGLENDVLIAQEHSPEDDTAFIAHVSEFLRDPRYLRICGKPLLMVYRPSLLPDAKVTATRWREFCRREGIGEIFLAYTQSFECVDPAAYGFDAAVEFPPNNSSPPVMTDTVVPLNPRFGGTVYDWRVFVQRSREYTVPPYPLFRGVCPSWDNTARKPGRGVAFLHSSPAGYREWLFNAALDTARRLPNPDDRLVFVNAWNEWAEGAYLEPDERYGYAYLAATRTALQLSRRAFDNAPAPIAEPRGLESGDMVGTPGLWVVVHSYHTELLDEILRKLAAVASRYSVMLTVPQECYEAACEKIRAYDIQAECLVCENRGRDILPFIEAARLLRDRGAEVILKLHTKKSIHRADGNAWRNELVSKLLDPAVADQALEVFQDSQSLGMIAPTGSVVPLTYYWEHNEARVRQIMRSMVGQDDGLHDENFVAGSMFYVRVDALRPLLNSDLGARDFEAEAGQVDGTMAHAIERCFMLICDRLGYECRETGSVFAPARVVAAH